MRDQRSGKEGGSGSHGKYASAAEAVLSVYFMIIGCTYVCRCAHTRGCLGKSAWTRLRLDMHT